MSGGGRGPGGLRVLLAAVLVISAGATLAAGSLAALAAVEIWQGGVMTVAVEESGPGGSHVVLAAPGALASLAAFAIPAALPDEAATRLRPHAPLLRAVADRLGELPDAVLVAVDGPDERVRVSVHQGALRIEVDDRGDHVRVSIPLHAVRRVLVAVARTAEARG